jgi:hypothetical protein
MKPARDEPKNTPEPGAKPKPKRFRIVKLEERIAPSKGGKGTNNGCYSGHTCAYSCPCYSGRAGCY